jgi:hypothetical protein
MSLLTIVITLIVYGVILYLINKFIPIQQNIKNLINILVTVVLVLWLLKVLGFWAYLSNVVL